jgi:hypothetical protein
VELSGRNVLSVALALGLSVALAACESAAERERERRPGAPAKTAAAPDGSVRLTPEQAQANGIQTAAVTAAEVAATITAIGRVEARAGGEA